MFQSQGACQRQAPWFILLSEKSRPQSLEISGMQPAVDKKKLPVGGLFAGRPVIVMVPAEIPLWYLSQ